MYIHVMLGSRNLTQIDQEHGTTWKDLKIRDREDVLKSKAQTSLRDSYYAVIRYMTRFHMKQLKEAKSAATKPPPFLELLMKFDPIRSSFVVISVNSAKLTLPHFFPLFFSNSLPTSFRIPYQLHTYHRPQIRPKATTISKRTPMERGDGGISKSLQSSQKLLFETLGSRGDYRVSLRIWSAGSGSSVDQQASPPQVNETNCIEQYLLEVDETSCFRQLLFTGRQDLFPPALSSFNATMRQNEASLSLAEAGQSYSTGSSPIFG